MWNVWPRRPLQKPLRQEAKLGYERQFRTRTPVPVRYEEKSFVSVCLCVRACVWVHVMAEQFVSAETRVKEESADGNEIFTRIEMKG